MMATQWLQRTARANGAHLADASQALANALHETGDTLARQRDTGLRAMRELGGSALGNARQMGRSTRSLVAERPLEAVLLVGLAGFAIGWLVRRSREMAARPPRAPRPRAAAARSTRPARTRTSRQQKHASG
jgi:ElaB/YqjD/DUF883 family membrane-anchored ribosome-binding protein